jgi:hypothetical protein
MKTTSILILALALLSCALFPSCMQLKGNERTGEWQANALGTDIEDFNISSRGAQAKVINNSKSFKYGCDLAKKLWDAYMMYMGFKWVSGLYYDHLGNQLNSETSVQLENLRNAHTEKMAAQEFEKLKFMHTAAPPTPGA